MTAPSAPTSRNVASAGVCAAAMSSSMPCRLYVDASTPTTAPLRGSVTDTAMRIDGRCPTSPASSSPRYMPPKPSFQATSHHGSSPNEMCSGRSPCDATKPPRRSIKRKSV